ncbi:tail fiber domain-containing protein [Roseivirga sp. BDSF3-8]|uniref:tail fiber domain-containing protein n=1 Tax=Roseivirga sp. BDSF3-8 TaxID=3241598 RepID=UPI003531921B
MKNLFTSVKAVILSTALLAVSFAAEAQWTGTSPFLSGELASRLGPVAVGTNSIPFAPPGPALKLYVNENFGQRSAGTFGSVTSASSEWTSIGRGPNGVLPFYGIRMQDGPLSLLTGSDDNNQPTVSWTDNLNTASSSNSELRFNFIGSDDIKRTYGRWDARGNLFLGTDPGGVSADFYELYVFGYQNSSGIRGQNINVDAGSESFNFGLFARTVGATSSNTAISARASSSANVVTAVDANASGGNTNYGVRASASGGSTNFAGFFSGNVTVTGTFSNPSDARLKNVVSNENARQNGPTVLERLRMLKAYDYTYKNEGDLQRLNLPRGEHHGFMAQEMQQVFPALVEEIVYMHIDENAATGEGDVAEPDKMEYLGVNYIGMIPYLAEAIQELDAQQQENAALQQKLTALESEMADMRRKLDEISNTGSTDALQGKAKVFGNTPNPFSAETRIAYELPASSNATLLVYDMSGKQVMSFDNLRAGNGEVVIEGRSLEPGMYIYTLISDGEEVDTHRMILTK